MNFVSVISVSIFSAGFSWFHSYRALKSNAIDSGGLAMLGTAIFLVGAGALFYLLVFTSMLGESPSKFLTPSLLGPKGDRSVLWFYALTSGGLAVLVAAGLARIVEACKA